MNQILLFFIKKIIKKGILLNLYSLIIENNEKYNRILKIG